MFVGLLCVADFVGCLCLRQLIILFDVLILVFFCIKSVKSCIISCLGSGFVFPCIDNMWACCEYAVKGPGVFVLHTL